jgi:hypothetical protein
MFTANYEKGGNLKKDKVFTRGGGVARGGGLCVPIDKNAF